MLIDIVKGTYCIDEDRCLPSGLKSLLESSQRRMCSFKVVTVCLLLHKYHEVRRQATERTAAMTTSDSEAAFSMRDKSLKDPMIVLTPKSLSFSALSSERTRAVNCHDEADSCRRNRSRTVPPMYPVAPVMKNFLVLIIRKGAVHCNPPLSSLNRIAER